MIRALIGRPADRDPEEIVHFVNAMIVNYGSDIRLYSAFDEETGNEAILCSDLPIEEADAKLRRLLYDDLSDSGGRIDAKSEGVSGQLSNRDCSG